MSNDQEVEVSRGEGDESREAQQAQSEALFGAALEQVDTELAPELGQAPPFQGSWNIWAFGPWQTFNQRPSRIIMVNEWARLHTVVWMDPVIMGPNIAAHGDKIELEYFTSNMEKMVPAGPPLNRHVCIDTQNPQIRPSGYYFHDWWWFRPTEAACLYEMNICARICNCRNQPVREYAAFVRYVWDYDPEQIRPLVRPWQTRPAGWSFNDPIRFAVFDKSPCDCP
jgi:hypothetical protein